MQFDAVVSEALNPILPIGDGADACSREISASIKFTGFLAESNNHSEAMAPSPSVTQSIVSNISVQCHPLKSDIRLYSQPAGGLHLYFIPIVHNFKLHSQLPC